jgi:hypothetical protein
MMLMKINRQKAKGKKQKVGIYHFPFWPELKGTVPHFCLLIFAFCLLISYSMMSQSITQPTRPRARDLGIPFDGTPGPHNAITDVRGVEVGMTTIIRGEGALKQGQGPVRTGVTVIFPRGKAATDPVFAAWFAQNGNGEMTGTTWIDEGGFMEGPVFITNTHSVGVVRDAAIAWSVRHDKMFQPFQRFHNRDEFDG